MGNARRYDADMPTPVPLKILSRQHQRIRLIIVLLFVVINLVVAAIAGVGIPLLLRRMFIDPALAGGVILTTVTDVVGFMTFLGLGATFLVR